MQREYSPFEPRGEPLEETNPAKILILTFCILRLQCSRNCEKINAFYFIHQFVVLCHGNPSRLIHCRVLWELITPTSVHLLGGLGLEGP